MGRKPQDQIRVYANLGVRLTPDLREDTKVSAALAGLSLNAYTTAALEYFNALQRARREKMNDQQQQIELVR
jgi:predicted HicB family RNase H-like nuclease